MAESVKAASVEAKESEVRTLECLRRGFIRGLDSLGDYGDDDTLPRYAPALTYRFRVEAEVSA